ncbi:MAG: 4-hydroxy-3-methylbut-2-enyl diphosphate reductase [bacterium]
MKNPIIIAIDGPSGSGKSTVSSALAKALGYGYINSGFIYRAIAFKTLYSNIPLDEKERIVELARNTLFAIRQQNGYMRMLVDKIDVTDELKKPDVAQASSKISVFREVRDIVNSILHNMVKTNSVVEGRDIGTVVFPDADVKFFITASPEVRAYRRYEELKGSTDVTYEQILEEIKLRDQRDQQREIAPMLPAKDAIIVDTTEMPLNAVITFVYNEVKGRLSQKLIDTVNGIEFYITLSAGFCFGVKRAIDIAIKTSKQQKNVYTLGPLIHNPQEVKRLEDMGIKPVEDINEVTAGTLIYRSHGVTAEESQKAIEKGLNIIDATCPFVTRSQKLVRALTRKGFHVVIVGDIKHPEVQSLLSYAKPFSVTVVKNPEELPPAWNIKKIAVLAQTTQSMENFKNIVSKLTDNAFELVVYNTICDATKIRQDESAALAGMVDVMFVVGGFNSSNTNKLANICKTINPKTYHIEYKDQIKKEMLINAKKVGITAGASTPTWLIKDVLKRLKEIAGYLSESEIKRV